MLNYLRFNVILLLSLSIITSQTRGMSAIEVMEGYFNDVNESRWTNVDKWSVKEVASEMESFMKDKENQEKKLGLFNIRNARLLKWKELPFNYAENYLPNHYIE